MFESCLRLFKLSNNLDKVLVAHRSSCSMVKSDQFGLVILEAYLSMSVFVSHSVSGEARHLVCTLTQLGLQTYTEPAHAAEQHSATLARFLHDKTAKGSDGI